MGSHIIEGEFQSDKYPTTPRGKVPLSVKDPTAQDLLWEYAQRRRAVDEEFATDLETSLITAGYQPPHATGNCSRFIDQHVEAVVGSDPESRSKWKDLAGRAVNAAALVTLVTSVDYPDALDAYTMIQQVLEGTSSQEQRSSLVRTLEDRKEHLIDLAKDGDASPDPNLARAAQGLLPAVQTALGMLTKLSEFGPAVGAS